MFFEFAQHGKRALLIVDEAQNLTLQAMEELRMLSNYQLNNEALLQSILVGQPEFRGILESPHMEQLCQRVIAACHISPMARPVVVAQECADAFTEDPKPPFARARSAEDFVQATEALLCDPAHAMTTGQKARQFVVEHYRWDRQLALIEPFLHGCQPRISEGSLAAATQ